MTRARDMANLGSQAGSGLDASDITTGTFGSGITWPDGHVLQVLYKQTTSGSSSTTSQTYEDFVNLFLAITPSSTSNKILIITNAHIYLNANSSDAWRKVNFAIHNSISGGSSGVIWESSSATDRTAWGFFENDDSNRAMQKTPLTALHSPNTTSECTYKIQYCSGGGTSAQEDSSSYSRSDITLMEIVA